MKIFLKNLAGECYARGKGCWSHLLEEAFDFGSLDSAIAFLLNDNLPAEPYALCLSGPEDTIDFPLPDDQVELTQLAIKARLNALVHGEEFCPAETL